MTLTLVSFFTVFKHLHIGTGLACNVTALVGMGNAYNLGNLELIIIS